MFKDVSSEFDVLVASDVIGMGFNLNISRIIFSTMMKFDGFGMRELTVTEDGHIVFMARRAGRYGSKFPVGEVTCLNADDLSLLHSLLESPSPTLEEHFLENAKLSANYFIADCEEVLKVVAVIDVLPLGLHDKYLFYISLHRIMHKGALFGSKKYSCQGHLRYQKTEATLKELESIHKVLDLYIWLSFLLEESFPDNKFASTKKSICNMLIEDFMEKLGWHKRRTKRLVSRTPSTSLLSRIARPNL